MEDRFRDVKADFDRMTRRYRDGEISWREYVEGLKQMRFKDEAGRFWMIGAQTGLWYFYDGAGWVQSPPPSLGEKKAICIYCGYENDLEAAACAGCGGRVTGNAPEETCPACGAALDAATGACPSCAPETAPRNGGPEAQSTSAAGPGESFVIHSVHPLSSLWLWGGLGLVAGVLFGLVAGATSFVPGVADALPQAFKEMQGEILGGMVFAGLGGVAGFALFGGAGLLVALVANAVLSISGGMKVKLGRPAPPPGKGLD